GAAVWARRRPRFARPLLRGCRAVYPGAGGRARPCVRGGLLRSPADDELGALVQIARLGRDAHHHRRLPDCVRAVELYRHAPAAAALAGRDLASPPPVASLAPVLGGRAELGAFCAWAESGSANSEAATAAGRAFSRSIEEIRRRGWRNLPRGRLTRPCRGRMA